MLSAGPSETAAVLHFSNRPVIRIVRPQGLGMKLRDHPLMTRLSGVKAWPPLWVDICGPAFGRPRGEVGILKKVETHQHIENGLFLWIDYEGREYVGMMHFDDPAFCREINGLLLQNIGSTIEQIGDIDLSHLL